MVATIPQSERDPAKIVFSLRQVVDLFNQMQTVTSFSNRPTTGVREGWIIPFSDSATSTWGATITGAGSSRVLGYYNGTAWTVAAR